MGKGKDFRDRILKTAVASATPAVLGAAAITGVASNVHAALVINEVYGGGGTTNTTVSYQQDFIELYNNGTDPISIGGDLVEYASATGSFPATTAATNVSTLSSGVLAAGGYFLLAGATQGTLPGAALPTPDETSTLNLAATAGKVELLFSDGTTVLDLVGYGSTANAREGTNGTLSNAPAPSITTSDNRTGGIDTNNNNLDFTIAAPTPSSGGFTPTAAPEPTSLGLLAAASALVIGRRRRS
jgi:hypothetical protein